MLLPHPGLSDSSGGVTDPVQTAISSCSDYRAAVQPVPRTSRGTESILTDLAKKTRKKLFVTFIDISQACNMFSHQYNDVKKILQDIYVLNGIQDLLLLIC